jgi:hypothetical protein
LTADIRTEPASPRPPFTLDAFGRALRRYAIFLMTHSDFVVVACLLNKETRHLLNPTRLALMKPTAYLINVARGPIVDEEALIAALREERIAGAGLDVFEQEPPDPANPLFAMDNVISTAHNLCWTDSFVDAVARDAITGIINVIQGRLPDFVVNPEATTHPRVRLWSSGVILVRGCAKPARRSACMTQVAAVKQDAELVILHDAVKLCS